MDRNNEQRLMMNSGKENEKYMRILVSRKIKY